MIIAVNSKFYKWLESLRKYPAFVDATSLTSRLKDEQYDLELVVRYLAFRTLPVNDIKKIGVLSDYLNDESVKFAEGEIDYDLEEDRFKKTFDFFNETLGDDSFHTFNTEKGRFQGSFSNTAFELVGLGLAHHIDYYISNPSGLDIENKVKRIWSDGRFIRGFATGKRADERLGKTLPAGRRLFDPSARS